MLAARKTLVRSSAFAVLLGALTVLWPAPAQAVIPGLTIDDYSGDTPPGTRTGTGAGGGSVTFTSGVARVSVPGANGVSASITYAFTNNQDLTAGGSATQLQMDYGPVTSSNPNVNDATGNFSLTVTDVNNATSQAFGNTRPGQTVSVMVFGSPTGLSGSADLTQIKAVKVDWFPGSNLNNYSQVIDIEKLWTLNPNVTAPQAITFTSTPPNPGHVGDTYTVTATGGGSGNPVTFSVGPGTSPGACTVAGSIVSFGAVGTCVVAANQAGNATYDPAPQVTQTITVAKIAQVINFTSVPPNPGAINGTYTAVATGGGSGNPVTFSLGAGTTNSACTVVGSAVSFAHAGTCVVAANQAGDATHDPAPQVTQTITVAKTAQVINFTSTPPNPAAINGTYTLAATGGGSGNAVTFSLGAGTTNSACTVVGSTVSFAHAGTCVVAADQAGNADFNAAPQATQTITVGKTAQAISFTSAPPSPAFVGTTYTVTALGGGSGSPVTFSTASAACTVVGSTVSFVAAGACNVDANQAGNADFAAAPQVTQIITVTKVTSTVTVDTAPTTTVHGQAATATAHVTPALGTAAGTVQFSLDGTPLGAPVPVAGGTASKPLAADLAAGNHVIGAAFAPTDTTTFATATGSGTLSVGKASTTVAPTITAGSLRAQVASTPPGAGIPTGTVRFLVDGTQVGTANVDGTGLATLAHALPPGASRTVAAAYDGDTNFLASSGSTSRTDPKITASATGKPKKSKAGWYRGKVTVTFTCAASGSPLTTACPTPVVLKKNGADQEVTGTVQSANGGIGTASLGGINIDHTKPRVQIVGVKTGGHYPSAPQARCQGVDKLSGIKTCRIKQRELPGHKVRYTAIAMDKAGNKSRRSVTIALSQSRARVSILGLAAHDGAFDVQLGGSYTLVVIGGPQPQYVDAAPAPQQPSGLDAFFQQDGTVNGQPRWVIGVTITTNMGGHELWNLGVLQGGQLHVVKVRVH